MNPKVSLIIPVYKVEKYLPRCLESVAAQTYDNFETILVDDGSPDRCGKMCDAFAAAHENVIVIHQENQGLSGARNNGLEIATGEYVAFIDSDDYVSEDYIEYLVNLIVEYGTDISVGGISAFFFNREPVLKKKREESRKFSRIESIKRMLYGKGFVVSACGKCYRRSLFSEVQYPEGKLFEDLDTTYKLFSKTDAIAYGSRFIYFYRQREESIMHQSLTEKMIEDGLDAAENVIRFMKDNIPEAEAAARSRHALEIVKFAARVTKNNEENREMFRYLRDKLKPIAREVLCDREVPWLTKLKIVAICMGYFPTCILMRAIDFSKKLR